MKNYICYIILSILFPINALSQPSTKPDYSWRSDDWSGKRIDKVKFENGESILVVKDTKLPSNFKLKGDCEFQRIEIEYKGGSKPIEVCDGLVSIRTAFPSINNAKIAIIETNCGGTMCSSYSDVYVFINSAKGIQIIKVGTSYIGPQDRVTTFNFWLDSGKIKSSVINNFFDGSKNNYGDLISSVRHLNGKGLYLDTRFKKDYEKFIDEHPDKFLGDTSARSKLLKIVTPEDFVEYRESMSGPGWSSVANGRFIVMNACKAHACQDQFGAVIIDGFTGDTHTIKFDMENLKYSSASTRALDPNIDFNWLSLVDTHDFFSLNIKNKKIVVEKNN